MQRLLWLLVIVLVAIAGWHVVDSFGVRKEAERLGDERVPDNAVASASVNPITNRITIRITTPFDQEQTDPLAALGAALGSALGEAVYRVFEPAVERELNRQARERFDVYAMAIPYRVRIEVGEDRD